MKILAIETSCDDTGIAVLKIKNSKFEVLSNIVSSQVKLHKKYGGVYPLLARREHERNLAPILKKALLDAKLLKPKNKTQKAKLDLIAVTVGPGLEPCLWTGINFAVDLAKKMDLPLVPVNHIEAHILANFIDKNPKSFPAICLVVSGGHTQLILMKRMGEYKILGETRDDAAGECLDKVARILGLDYPGGPEIAKEAAKSNQKKKYRIKLPRPMIYQKNYDFSFSGLKTAVLYDFKSRSPKIRKSKNYRQEMCFETQQAVTDVLIRKTLKAAKDFKAKTIILGGGVTANQELRERLKERIKKDLPKIAYYRPEQKYCTDNALMTAVAAYYRQKEKTKNWKKIMANANLAIGESL